MSNKKLKVQANREDEYIIEFDESLIDEKHLAQYGQYFHEVGSIEEYAEELAYAIIRNGTGRFMEGFGYIKMYNQNGVHIKCYDGIMPIAEEQYVKGIKVTVIAHDEEYYFNVEELADPVNTQEDA